MEDRSQCLLILLADLRILELVVRIIFDLFLGLLLTLLFLFFLSSLDWLLLGFLLKDLVSLGNEQLFWAELLLDSCH